jgi:ribosomal protein L19E
MANSTERYIKDLLKRTDVPAEVKDALSKANTKGEAQRIWKEHARKAGTKKGAWLDGR